MELSASGLTHWWLLVTLLTALNLRILLPQPWFTDYNGRTAVGIMPPYWNFRTHSVVSYRPSIYDCNFAWHQTDLQQGQSYREQCCQLSLHAFQPTMSCIWLKPLVTSSFQIILVLYLKYVTIHSTCLATSVWRNLNHRNKRMARSRGQCEIHPFALQSNFV